MTKFHPQIDFVRTTQRPSRLALTTLLVGLLCLCVGATTLYDQQMALMAARKTLANAEKTKRLEADRRAETLRNQESDAMVWKDPRWIKAKEELMRPWMPVLAASETAAAPPIYLLALNMDPEKRSIQLDGLAPDFNAVITAVKNLQGQKVLLNPQVVSRESVDMASDGPAIRFAVRAQWRYGS